MDIIEKLNNITIDDIKNIDVEEIKEKIVSRPDILIMIVCIALCVIAMVYGLSNYNSKSKGYKTKITELKEKQKQFDFYDKTKESYDNFNNTFPKPIEKDALAEIISGFADDNNMSIISFSPEETKDLGFASFQDFTLIVSTSNNEYDDLILFIKDIEDSPYALRIASWKNEIGKASSRRRRRTEKPEAEVIKSRITLQLITLNK